MGTIGGSVGAQEIPPPLSRETASQQHGQNSKASDKTKSGTTFPTEGLRAGLDVCIPPPLSSPTLLPPRAGDLCQQRLCESSYLRATVKEDLPKSKISVLSGKKKKEEDGDS